MCYLKFMAGLIYFSHKSALPDGTKPLCLILYADKTKLSSFGTEMGYPILARCTNLPTDVCNGEGIGGGRVVGWLPMVRIYSSLKTLYAIENFHRLRKMRTRKVSTGLLTSNTSFGMSRFANSLKRLKFIHASAVCVSAVMQLPGSCVL